MTREDVTQAVTTRLRVRARHHGHHGHRHIDKQRLISLLMITTGIARAMVWLTLIIVTLAGLTFAVHLFSQVLWVAVLSLYANFATDLSTVAGSWASLVAGDAHGDIEHVRQTQASAFRDVEHDLETLAALQPGPEAQALAAAIKARLTVSESSRTLG